MKTGENRSQDFHQAGRVGSGKRGHSHMLLDAGLENLSFLHHAAGIHQVSGFSNDHAGGTGKLLLKNMPDLQRAADVPGVEQDDLSVPQIWRALTGDGTVGIGGGDH